MRVREENCNMVLLATVAIAGVMIAGGISLLEPAPTKQQVASEPTSLADSTPVRIVGARFVPNTNPRERH